MVMPSDLKRFENVTIYTDDDLWGNIHRIDARHATIWIDPYAQYHNAVFVEFVGVGKRKTESFVRADDPYVVVVPLDRAIEPDELYVETKDNIVAATRYSTTDPRWREDFDLKLLLSSTLILADYRAKDIIPEPPTLIEAKGKSPSSAHEQPIIAEAHKVEEFEREEGIRASSERSFFERNPALARRAKEVYGCACQVCGFDFVHVYGEIGRSFAEVHHLNPLSERPASEWTEAVLTKIADVAVLCANCHRMIHRRRPALSLDELRSFMRTESK
jgi:5-methylcytosine-specific restriction endonuclease McrA